MHKQQKRSGFTLIELLVVSTIIVVLGMIGMASFANASKGARDGKRKSDMETIRQAAILYKQQYGSYPASIGTMEGSYLSQPIPADPGSYTYSYWTNSSSLFCTCAQMESGKGNTGSNPGDYNCSGVGGTTTGDYYCAKNL
jgi:prepilin-type N-terminal cleavage/methylation domain-containing protein